MAEVKEVESTPAESVAAEVASEETPLESLSSICTVLAVGLFLMAFVFQNYVIPSGSMEKTLLIGDHVFVDRMTLAPPTRWAFFEHYRDVRRGDIIVFMKPNPETPDLVLVKRAIGLPGDRIHLRNGVVYLNGVAQVEPAAGMPHQSADPQDAYEPTIDDFPAKVSPPDPPHSGLKMNPPTSSATISSYPQARSSPWAITAITRSMAASGASFPVKIFSAARSSTTGPLKLPPVR